MDEASEPPKRGATLRGARTANVAGALGTVWLTYAAPNSLLLTLFLQEWLHAAKWQIGLVLAINNLGPTLEPLGAWLAERYRCRKLIFILTHLCNRLPFALFAALPWLEPTDGNRSLAIAGIIAIVTLTRVAGHLGAPSWWTWMADLIPSTCRGQWLSRRVQANSAVAAGCIALASVLLQYLGGMHCPWVVAALFAFGAICGTIDILLYALVPPRPMPASAVTAPVEVLQRATQPFATPHFGRYLLALGIWLLGINLFLPFVPLYLRGEMVGGERIGLGVSWIYLAAVNVAAQLGAMTASRWWGGQMRRFGSLWLVVIGTGHFFVHVLYLGATPGQYHVLLLLTALASGVLLAAWTIGTQQLLLELSPQAGRSYYTSAFNMTNGWFTALGTFLGGLIAGSCPALGLQLPNGMPVTYLHVLLLAGLALGSVAVVLIVRLAPHVGRGVVGLPGEMLAGQAGLRPRFAGRVGAVLAASGQDIE